jgi:hypothetical protein
MTNKNLELKRNMNRRNETMRAGGGEFAHLKNITRVESWTFKLLMLQCYNTKHKMTMTKKKRMTKGLKLNLFT